MEELLKLAAKKVKELILKKVYDAPKLLKSTHQGAVPLTAKANPYHADSKVISFLRSHKDELHPVEVKRLVKQDFSTAIARKSYKRSQRSLEDSISQLRKEVVKTPTPPTKITSTRAHTPDYANGVAVKELGEYND